MVPDNPEQHLISSGPNETGTDAALCVAAGELC